MMTAKEIVALTDDEMGLFLDVLVISLHNGMHDLQTAPDATLERLIALRNSLAGGALDEESRRRFCNRVADRHARDIYESTDPVTTIDVADVSSSDKD